MMKQVEEPDSNSYVIGCSTWHPKMYPKKKVSDSVAQCEERSACAPKKKSIIGDISGVAMTWPMSFGNGNGE